jgi:hypothetical protein
MADLNLKDKGGIFKHGGGILRVVICDDAGTLVGADFTDLGYIEVTEFYDERGDEDIFDETGKVVKRRTTDRTVGLDATLMQANKEIFDFLMTTNTEQTYYHLYYKRSKTGDVNAKTQELFGAIAQIKPSFRIRSGDQKIPIRIVLLPNESAVVIDNTPTNLFDSLALGDVTIAANTYWTLVETA